jgi:osmotically-inducible protein OsmY
MSRTAALLILPMQPRRDAEKDAFQVSAGLLKQSLADLRLSERIECILRASGFGSLSNLEITVHVGLVILEGRVPTYYLKQVAQAIVLALPGVQQVRNDLNVVRPKRTASKSRSDQ